MAAYDNEMEDIRQKVTERIGEVEKAVESLQDLRKSLLQEAYETKQSILAAFVNQRDSMRSKEVQLLGEVDNLLHSKDDALVTQLSKLNQVLGCLRNCLRSDHPCGECLEKFEDIDMHNVMDVRSEFTTANDAFRTALASTRESVSSFAPTSDPSFKQDTAALLRSLGCESGNLTQWLVTPTNVEKPRMQSSVSIDSGDRVNTEWLLQRHSKPSGKIQASTSSLFSVVNTDQAQNWLRDCKRGGDKSTSSLYAYVFKQFSSVIQQPNRDWLQQKDGLETGSAYCEDASVTSDSSVSSSSTSTSSLSSCVIVPSCSTSHTDEDYSFSGSNNWLQKPVAQIEQPNVLPDKPQDISLWVASCEPSDCNTWLAASDRRLRQASVSSMVEPMSDLQLNPRQREAYEEWRLDETMKHIHFDNKLTAPTYNKDSTNQWLQQDGKEHMLVKLGYDPCDWLDCDEEKHDMSVEKIEGCAGDDEWLAMKSPVSNQWLQAELNSSAPAVTRSHGHMDKEWLYVVNTMSKIAGSDSSEWLQSKPADHRKIYDGRSAVDSNISTWLKV